MSSNTDFHKASIELGKMMEYMAKNLAERIFYEEKEKYEPIHSRFEILDIR